MVSSACQGSQGDNGSVTMKIAAALPFAILLQLCLVGLVGCAATPSSQNDGAGPSASGELARPADVDRWISVGTTMRMSAADPALPNQFRHVQLEPGAYKALLDKGAYPDGAVLAVTFYSAQRGETETPTLYAPHQEVFFGLEILDTSHPDGRRFYSFVGSARTATPMPAGNACAVCHNAKGSLQGTFAHDYPVIARFAKTS